MKPVKFKQLSILQKAKELVQDGSSITSIWYYEYKINLYLYCGQYIEVFYDPKKDLVKKIEFLDMECTRLKFYLDQVKLPSNISTHSQ